MPIQEIEVVSKTDRREAEALLARVDELLDRARSGRNALNSTYVEIGVALDAVENTRAWMQVARSYDGYIRDHCEPRFGKSRTQLYGARSAAKYLLPHMTPEQLVEIGISKAMPLAQYTKRSGGKLPVNLIESAMDPEVGVEEFKASIAETQHDKPEKGKWYDFGGAFLTADEKIEMDAGLERAETIEPLPKGCPSWMIRKIVMQRLIAEFLSTYPCTENG